MSDSSDNRGQAPVAADALRLEGVACARGERVLFEGLDVCVAAGGIAWLRGANGQGKTMCDDQTFLAYLRQVFGLPAGQ